MRAVVPLPHAAMVYSIGHSLHHMNPALSRKIQRAVLGGGGAPKAKGKGKGKKTK